MLQDQDARKVPRADFILLLATALWGLSFVAVKRALADATPLAFLALRFGLATLFLAPVAQLGRRFTGPELQSGLLLAGLVALGFMTQTVGLVTTTPSRSAFIVALSSVLAPLVAFAFLGEHPRWTVVGALVIAILGVYLLTAPDAGGLNRGDVWTLACAVCFGGQIVAVTELARRSDAGRLIFLQNAGIAALAALAALAVEQPHVSWTAGFTGALAYTVVFASVVAFLLQMQAQRQMSSARAALIFCLEPVFAAGTSWLVLGERLSATQWVGGALILAGMVAADFPVQGSTITRQTSDVRRQ